MTSQLNDLLHLAAIQIICKYIRNNLTSKKINFRSYRIGGLFLLPPLAIIWLVFMPIL